MSIGEMKLPTEVAVNYPTTFPSAVIMCAEEAMSADRTWEFCNIADDVEAARHSQGYGRSAVSLSLGGLRRTEVAIGITTLSARVHGRKMWRTFDGLHGWEV